jgi:hypothetical protein
LFKSASHKNGLKYLDAQSYDQAVEMLTIAAHEDPKNVSNFRLGFCMQVYEKGLKIR